MSETKNKIYSYKGKRYCDDYPWNTDDHYDGDLQDLLSILEKDHPQIYCETVVTTRYIGGEYAGTYDEKSDEETLDELIEYGYGEDIELEKEEE